MLTAMNWIGLFGGWLLVAGPVYQASIELREHSLERDRIQKMASTVAVPHVSRWWWLVPPLRWYLENRRRDRYFNAVLSVLEPSDVRSIIGLFDKAVGWMLVASGAVLLATKETFGFAAANELGVGPASAIVVGFSLVCAAITFSRAKRSKQLIVRHASPKDAPAG